jgi:hypothetical protein
MNKLGWIAAVGIVAWFMFAGSGSRDQKAPDEGLAEHFDAMCDIARENMESPKRGVRQLGRYLAKHTGDMMKQLGDTLALIERIEDDDEHDQRAVIARERMAQPLLDCERDWRRFGDAVEANPEANELVQTTRERFGRTIRIIFPSVSAGPERFDLRSVPQRLRALTQRFSRP